MLQATWPTAEDLLDLRGSAPTGFLLLALWRKSGSTSSKRTRRSNCAASASLCGSPLRRRAQRITSSSTCCSSDTLSPSRASSSPRLWASSSRISSSLQTCRQQDEGEINQSRYLQQVLLITAGQNEDQQQDIKVHLGSINTLCMYLHRGGKGTVGLVPPLALH